MIQKNRSARWVVVAAMSVLIVGCGPAEGVEVQELPELTRPSPEARAGLAELAGTWNHAGWMVARLQLADAADAERAPRSLAIQQQRLDSISGYVVREASRRFVGEVRRDGIVSLLVRLGDDGNAVIAGVVERDTLWLELSTLPGFNPPTGARAAYVRAPVGQVWVRLPSGALVRDTAVTVMPDMLPPGTAPAPGAPSATAAPEAREPVLPSPEPPTQPADTPAPLPADPGDAPEPQPVDPTPQRLLPEIDIPLPGDSREDG
jgi:hypothetical protein